MLCRNGGHARGSPCQIKPGPFGPAHRRFPGQILQRRDEQHRPRAAASPSSHRVPAPLVRRPDSSSPEITPTPSSPSFLPRPGWMGVLPIRAAPGYTASSGAYDDGRPLLQCACRVPAARFTSTKQASRGKSFFKCRSTSCFTWIWEERLMDFVNALVRRSTAAIEGELQVAKTESEWRIHLVQHKLEVARHELSEAIGERDGSKAVATRLAEQLKSRDRSIMFYRLVVLICMLCMIFRWGV